MSDIVPKAFQFGKLQSLKDSGIPEPRTNPTDIQTQAEDASLESDRKNLFSFRDIGECLKEFGRNEWENPSRFPFPLQNNVDGGGGSEAKITIHELLLRKTVVGGAFSFKRTHGESENGRDYHKSFGSSSPLRPPKLKLLEFEQRPWKYPIATMQETKKEESFAYPYSVGKRPHASFGEHLNGILDEVVHSAIEQNVKRKKTVERLKEADSSLGHSLKKDRNTLPAILIDGRNVALEYTKHQSLDFIGIQLCIAHFEGKGHKVIKVLLPKMQFSKLGEANLSILKRLSDKNAVIFTKLLPGYQDNSEKMIECTVALDGYIVTNEKFKCIVDRQELVKRQLPYVFSGNDFILLGNVLPM